MHRSLHTTTWARDAGIVGDTQASDEMPNKMVTTSYTSVVDPTASVVDPTSVNDMTAYERNGSVMIQLYDEKNQAVNPICLNF